MSYFDDIYTKLFGKVESKSNPISVNETLERSESFAEKFQSWKDSPQSTELLENIWQSYFWGKQGVDKEPRLSIMESSYSNGLAISFNENYGKQAFQYLLDYLAEKVMPLGYIQMMSRRTMQEKGSVVESKELRYLKPKRGFVEPIEQLYGNIQIEYVEENDEPKRIKFVANSYPDRKYKQARKFEDLALHVFSTNNEN